MSVTKDTSVLKGNIAASVATIQSLAMLEDPLIKQQLTLECLAAKASC